MRLSSATGAGLCVICFALCGRNRPGCNRMRQGARPSPATSP